MVELRYRNIVERYNKSRVVNKYRNKSLSPLARFYNSSINITSVSTVLKRDVLVRVSDRVSSRRVLPFPSTIRVSGVYSKTVQFMSLSLLFLLPGLVQPLGRRFRSVRISPPFFPERSFQGERNMFGYGDGHVKRNRPYCNSVESLSFACSKLYPFVFVTFH